MLKIIGLFLYCVPYLRCWRKLSSTLDNVIYFCLINMALGLNTQLLKQTYTWRLIKELTVAVKTREIG